MTKKNDAVESTENERPGWEFTIVGDALKPNASRWTPEQRERGILVRMHYLSGTEEEAAIAEGQAKDKMPAICQLRASLEAIDGKKVTKLDVNGVWEDLGQAGRTLCNMAYLKATTPSEEARAKVNNSFRIVF